MRNKIFNGLNFITAILCAGAVFAANDAMMAKALTPFGIDLKTKLSTGVKTLSIYAVLKDKENRYGDAALKKSMERTMRTVGFAVASRDEGIKASMSEIELSASGVIDVASVKQAGKIAGVDAFFFVYPSVGGIFGDRVTITVKGVNVATGAVIFAEEYAYDERPLIGIEIAIQYPVYSWFRPIGTLTAQPTGAASWTPWSRELTPGRPSITPMGLLGVTLNIPSTAVTLRGGLGVSSFDLGTAIFTNQYAGSNATPGANIPTQTMKSGLAATVDATIPISLLFGDHHDILRGYVGWQVVMFGSAGSAGAVAVAGAGTDGVGGDIKPIQQTPLLHAVRSGIEAKIAYGFCVTLSCTIALPWSIPASANTPENGINISFNSPLAAEIAMGVVYRIF
ncbi:MAG: hypothetical protein AABZ39_18285 [Spirochaetota bacterium]